MPQKTISIPIQGGKNTVRAVKRIAQLEDKTMAEVIFDAVRAKYGEQFTDLIEFYRAKSDHNYVQQDIERSA